MRVTNSMIAGRVTFNLQRALGRFLAQQTQMSSGRRINRASDDPIGTQRDLTYRTELAKNEQYRKNVSVAQTWTSTYDRVLGDLKNIVSSAKEIAIAMSNGTFDASAREAGAAEIKSMFDQIMQLSASEIEGKFMFSGFRTSQKALAATSNGVTYQGDQGVIEFSIQTGTRLDINMTADNVFLKSLITLGEEGDLNPGITLTTVLADLNNGNGIDQAPGTFSITDNNLGIISTVDTSSAATVGDLLTAINTQLVSDGITNLTASIGVEGNNIFFDVDETAPNLISSGTQISNLNSGNGVDLSTPQIVLSDGGVDTTIDFTGSQTVGDIIAAFNSQAPVGVTIQIAGGGLTGTALEIIDTNLPPLDLTVQEINSFSSVASQLGIDGFVGSGLVGSDLEPKYSFSIDEVAGTTVADLQLPTSLQGDRAGGDLDPLMLATTNLSDLHHGLGLDSGKLILWQGDSSRQIDLGDPSMITVQDLLDKFNNSGLDITASINPDGRGIQVVNNDQNRSFTIEDVGTSRAARTMGLFGSSDMMGTMLVLNNALINDDQEGTGLILEHLDAAIQHLLNNRAGTGARGIRLETTNTRLIDQELNVTQLLSDVEDADISKLITDLASMENNYRASLMAAAKIVQPSLLDFLR
ncbi:MAG: flagellar hook-associated protein FlgL [Candidatus Zixiibacteriota bacterium]